MHRRVLIGTKMSDCHSSRANDRVRSLLADDADWDELLRGFVESIPEKRQILRDLQRSASVDQIRVLAHQIKGAGGGYGFPGLTAAAAELEQACRTSDPNRVSTNVDQLVDYLDRIAI
jgi:HPt (histidine-containing phosphotransfer) domain-containing protein